MMRLVLPSAIALWIGCTLALSELRWFSRRPLSERLRVHTQTRSSAQASPGLFSVESFRDVVGPLSSALGGRLARMFGVSEELGLRLARIHSPLDPAGFRVRQFGWVLAGLAAGTLAATALSTPAPVTALLVLGAPILAFLVLEQQVATASTRRQQRITLELPVVAEQLGMLLSAGYSLGSALSRISERGQGACAEDLAQVSGRTRQGLSEVEALREWARLVRVDALDRLVGVLALNQEAGDLGRLIAEEARSIRRDVQRQLIESIERRGQQVWIPVTVATLLPGVIFMAIPFIQAMQMFSGS